MNTDRHDVEARLRSLGGHDRPAEAIWEEIERRADDLPMPTSLSERSGASAIGAGRARWRAAVAAVVVVAVGAAGLVAATRFLDRDDGVQTADASADWSVDPAAFGLGGGWVDLAPDGTFLSPGPAPAGTMFGSLTQPVDPVHGIRKAASTLYADPNRPGAGLLVGRDAMTDLASSIREVGAAVPGSDGLRLERFGELTVVRWDINLSEESCGCYQHGVVAGRGLSDDEVISAARNARASIEADDRPVLPPASVPAGMADLGTVPVLDITSDLRGEEVMLLGSAGSWAGQLWVVSTDPRAAANLTFLVSGATPFPMLPGPDARRIRLVPADGAAVVVWASPDRIDALSTWAGTFVAADDTAVAAVQDAINDRPLSSDDDCFITGESDPTKRISMFVGRLGDIRWVIGLNGDPTVQGLCRYHTRNGAMVAGGAESGPVMTVGDGPTVRVVPTVVDDQQTLGEVVGIVSDQTRRVSVLADGVSIEAEIGEIGPTESSRWYATVIDLPADHHSETVTVVAFAADGSELGRATAAT